MIEIKEFEEKYLKGSKRTNLVESNWLPGWFTGYGKDNGCIFEGTWWDMVCFARNVLASPNTKQCAPEFYKPEWKNDNYVGEECPYVVAPEETDDE